MYRRGRRLPCKRRRARRAPAQRRRARTAQFGQCAVRAVRSSGSAQFGQCAVRAVRSSGSAQFGQCAVRLLLTLELRVGILTLATQRRIFDAASKTRRIPSRSPMSKPVARLSRRERQIVEILYRLGRATVAEVHEMLPDPPPTVTATRSALWLLCEKGHVRRDQSGPRNVYLPAVPPETARASALR